MRNYRAGAVFKCFSTLVPVRWNAPRKLFQLSPPLLLCIVNRLNTSYVLSCLRASAHRQQNYALSSPYWLCYSNERGDITLDLRAQVLLTRSRSILFISLFLIPPLCAKMIHCYVFGFNIPNWKTVLVVWDKGKTRRKKAFDLLFCNLRSQWEESFSLLFMWARERETDTKPIRQST